MFPTIDLNDTFRFSADAILGITFNYIFSWEGHEQNVI